MKLPDYVLVAGIPYKISYVENASEVDIHKRESLWGQVDFWTKTIRIYKSNNPYASVIKVLLHEIVHAYGEEQRIDAIDGRQCAEPEEYQELEENVDTMARMLFDLLNGNEWICDIPFELAAERSKIIGE